MRPFIPTAAALLLIVDPGSSRADIANSKHNLSVSGPGSVVAESETRICVFCHTPHRASTTQGVLWNRNDSTATYIPYESSSLRAGVGQPNGASKLCLSCHDGTVALGDLISEPAELGFIGGVRFMPPGPGLIETDLSDDHPISFTYDKALVDDKAQWMDGLAHAGLVDPIALTGEVQLDQWGQLQCTSCHDPHDEGFGQFLAAPMRNSALCITCHDYAEWPDSSLAASGSTWEGSPPDPWPHTEFTTVAENACQNCHRTHSAESSAWLLTYAAEEDVCLACHNGSLAATDIEAEFNAPFHHPVEFTTDTHSPAEDATLPMTEHVECTDCHNPHAMTSAPAMPPLIPGALRGVSGIDMAGMRVASASYEYEVCYKCHADYPTTNPPINRQVPDSNKRLQFDVSSPSYHPIAAPGTNQNVPSLLPPHTVSSQIYCTDCHASSTGPGAGGTAPAGIHGSTYPFILERQYSTADGLPYDPGLYSLCYKCHSEQSISLDESFPTHALHIADTSCSTCHDAHGVSSVAGSVINNTHLMNFDLTVVQPDPATGRLEFEDLGTFKGQCYLQCHSVAHSPKSY